MIHVERGDEQVECPALAARRAAELGRVRPIVAAGFTGPWDELLGDDYKVAREPLAKRQHYKCCYCEAKFNGARWHTVEHVRPKSQYWWLTWTWDNLLFACHDCNHAKRAEFPLVDESARLQPEAQAPGFEEPLLLDPSRETNLRDYLRFVPLTQGHWFPVDIDAGGRGRAMLEALGWIDGDVPLQPGLMEKWKEHAKDVQYVVRQLRPLLADAQPVAALRAWNEHTTRLRRAGHPFVALSLDVLEHFLDREIERFDLPLTVLPAD